MPVIPSSGKILNSEDTHQSYLNILVLSDNKDVNGVAGDIRDPF